MGIKKEKKAIITEYEDSFANTKYPENVRAYFASKDLGIPIEVIYQVWQYNPPDYIYGSKLDGSYTRKIRPNH